jgi:type IV pilus assembly protein PilX
MKETCLLKNEDGSILVIGLIMLMLLTLLGISVTTTSTIEIQTAGNERVYKHNLYLAEAAALHGAQALENTDLANNTPTWLLGPLVNVDLDNDNIPDDNVWSANSQQSIDPSGKGPSRVLATFEGLAPGSSLDMTKASVYAYKVYGRSNRGNGLAFVEVGYRKAF